MLSMTYWVKIVDRILDPPGQAFIYRCCVPDMVVFIEILLFSPKTLRSVPKYKGFGQWGWGCG